MKGPRLDVNALLKLGFVGLSVVLLITCHSVSEEKEKAIVGVEANGRVPAESTQLTIAVSGNYPVVVRNLGCGSDSFVVHEDSSVSIWRNTIEDWESLNIDSDAANTSNTFHVLIPASLRPELRVNTEYRFRVEFTRGDTVEDQFVVWKTRTGETDSDTDSADSAETDVSSDSSTHTGDSETGSVGEVADTATGVMESDSATAVAVDTGSADTDSVDSGFVDTDSADTDSADTDSADTDTGFDATALHIEAECAFGAWQGDCNGAYEGNHSREYNSLAGAYVPSCDSSICQMVVYMYPGAWIAFLLIDFTEMNTITLRVASTESSGSLVLRLDDDEFGEEIATLETWSGGWVAFREVEASIENVTGVHTLYIVGGDDGTGPNANIDWLELSPTRMQQETDSCESHDDCYDACWDCAIENGCAEEEAACRANADCASIYNCIDIQCANQVYAAYTWCVTTCMNQNSAGYDAFGAVRECVVCDVCAAGCGAQGDIWCMQ